LLNKNVGLNGTKREGRMQRIPVPHDGKRSLEEGVKEREELEVSAVSWLK
jgi:hypothetical protein